MPIHSKTIGILGGGQLAQMLALKAKQMGLTTFVLSENAHDPAATVATTWMQGSLKSPENIQALAAQVDCLTFESEFIPAQLLKKSLQKLRTKRIEPNLNILAKMQDRLFQKEWLYDYGLPTLDYVKINSKDDLELAFKAFDGQMVCKERFGGYDGYGTYVITNKIDLISFKKAFKGEENQFIAERFVSFKSERSIIFARNTLGEMIHLPMVQSVQINHQCDYVMGPSIHPKEKKLIAKINQFLNAINYVGVIAFELFEIGPKLVINEVAPRVHNTGHFSQEALNIDQFELHLRCILGLKLPPVSLRQPAFVMVNLLGQSTRNPSIKTMPTGAMHWYDKDENRPRRKMGHINYIGKNKKALLKKALLERKGILL
ncbi:MAG: 5-(carboxyamino)imidazole ribonucleotide synthase [Bdellovibrio sp.]|nr:5-(carboxyamino)imidazole ribonucleotide synthase [Bdellovibrio sp.]